VIAIIQAGGKGARLQPYTFVMPKPLMPVGDLPVLEILLRWIRRWGIKRAIITTGYLGHLIRSLCSNGHKFDIDISFSQEPEPLGTIGALRLVQHELLETFLTLNGDLITDLNLREFVSSHKSHGGLLTVGVTEKNIKVDLGVLDAHEGIVSNFREKPSMRFKVSMGIYCMEPGIIELIPKGSPFGFDDLMNEMLQRKLPIHIYEHNGLWWDIGGRMIFVMPKASSLKNTKVSSLAADLHDTARSSLSEPVLGKPEKKFLRSSIAAIDDGDQ
jgi:mannose-1-phosphate guanylyltransferase